MVIVVKRDKFYTKIYKSMFNSSKGLFLLNLFLISFILYSLTNYYFEKKGLKEELKNKEQLSYQENKEKERFILEVEDFIFNERKKISTFLETNNDFREKMELLKKNRLLVTVHEDVNIEFLKVRYGKNIKIYKKDSKFLKAAVINLTPILKSKFSKFN